MKIFLLLFTMIFIACADTKPTDHVAIKLETTIHIVTSQDQFDNSLYKGDKRILGYAIPPDGPIWVVGKMDGKKLVVPANVLGHELLHILAAKDDRVRDPDVRIDKVLVNIE